MDKIWTGDEKTDAPVFFSVTFGLDGQKKAGVIFAKARRCDKQRFVGDGFVWSLDPKPLLDPMLSP
jgi:hypothetical protein